MALVEFAKSADRPEIERLIGEYHASEGVKPRAERISWAVDQRLSDRFPGILLVARQENKPVGVALAVYSPSAELGRVLVVNDFYVEPQARRKGIGRALAAKLVEEAERTHVDRIDLEVLPTNETAALFWQSIGFRTYGRTIYSHDLPST